MKHLLLFETYSSQKDLERLTSILIGYIAKELYTKNNNEDKKIYFTSDLNLIMKTRQYIEKIVAGKHCHNCGTKKLCQDEHEKFSCFVSCLS